MLAASGTATRFLGLALLLPVPLSSWAAEGGTTEYLGGFTGFAAGYVPIEPGTYFTNDLYFYSGSTSALAVNGKVALDVSTDVYMEIAQVTLVTDKTILGGTYGFGMAVPGGYVSVDAAVQPLGVERSTDTYGLGDLILVIGRGETDRAFRILVEDTEVFQMRVTVRSWPRIDPYAPAS